jgi:PmbA protein
MDAEDETPVIFAGSEKYAKIDNKLEDLPSAASLKKTALEIQKDTYSVSESVTDGTQSAVMASKCEIVLVNSRGLDLRNTVGMNGVMVQAVVNVDGESEDEFEFSEGMERRSYAGISERTVKKALSKLGAGEVESGKYDIVFSGKQMRAVLSTFSDVFSGKEALNGMSLLDGKVGERIAADCITVVDDPMREGSSMQMNFDGEGVATYRKNVIENGVLKTLLYDLATAKKVGVSSTGNGKRSSYTSPVSISP